MKREGTEDLKGRYADDCRGCIGTIEQLQTKICESIGLEIDASE